MSFDFFQEQCRENVRNDAEFGLCDPQDGGKAYSDTANKDDWIATVKNPDAKELRFTAIDKCVIKDEDLMGVGRCDGMISSDDLLIFIELKDKRSDWISDAIGQIEGTISTFKNNHPEQWESYVHKRACACNKKKKNPSESTKSRGKQFKSDHGFPLSLKADIQIA